MEPSPPAVTPTTGSSEGRRRAEPVYPVFVSYILVCALTLVGVLCVAVVIYFALKAQGLGHDAIVARLSADMVLSIVMGSPAQLVMLAGAWMLARQRNRPLRESLGLVTPSLTRAQWA